MDPTRGHEPDVSQPAPAGAAAARFFPADRFDAVYRALTGALGLEGGGELVDRIVGADVRSRLIQIDLPELQILRRDIEQLGRSGDALRWWVDAIIGERMTFDFDPTAVLWAVTRLHEMPTDPFAPVPVLYARARLRRIAVAGYLVEPSPDNVERFRSWRDEAIFDFIRCGFHDEALATRAMAAGLTVMFTWDEVWESLHRIDEVRAQLVDPLRSSMGFMVEYVRALVALIAGEMATAREALDDIEASGLHHPLLSFIVPFGRTFDVLMSEPDEPTLRAALADIDRRIGALALVSPRYPAFYQHLLAQLLADLRRPEARRYTLAALDMPSLGRRNRVERELLVIRTDSLAGIVPDAAHVKDLLERIAAHGRTRQAGGLAIRIARDLEWLGVDDDAAALRSWGIDRLPAPSDRTRWEHRWAQPVGATSGTVRSPAGGRAETRREHLEDGGAADHAGAAAGAGPELELHVMAPAAELTRRGVLLPVPDLAAKLLALLAAAHPRPLSAEQVVDALWSEGLTKDTRTRLNTTMHRLRKLVGSEVAVVTRRGDLLSIDASACRVDLVELRRALDGPPGRLDPPGAQAVALAAVRGNLCAQQFPDDEHLLDERERFVASWLDHARRLHATGDLPPDQLAGALAALGLRPSDLAD